MKTIARHLSGRRPSDPRRRRGALLLFLLPVALALAGGSPAQAQQAADPNDPWRFSNDVWDLKFGLDGAVQASGGRYAFWGLGQIYAPPEFSYDRSHGWMEGYVLPGVTASAQLGRRFTFYGGAAAVGSYTLGQDYFEQGDTGRVRLARAYAGLRWQDSSGDLRLDLSGGMQTYVLGNGLLLATGGGNGFERGCMTTFPYRSWAVTGIGRLAWKELSVEGFYLDADELKSSDTGTTLAGGKVEWRATGDHYAGFSYFKVLKSSSPYPQAPISIIENGRDGLATYDLYWKFAPTQGPLAGFSLWGEAALQRNDRINMKAWGGGFEIAYRFLKTKWMPRLSYSPRYYSGDDPDTPDRLERFDALFWDGSPPTWSSGGNGSLAYYNSNIVSYRVRLELVLDQANFLNANYWYASAAQRNSPIQFGQAARVVNTGDSFTIISGVPERSLSHESYVEYTRILGRHWFLTAGIALAQPASGLKAIGGTRAWWGGLVNVTFKY